MLNTLNSQKHVIALQLEQKIYKIAQLVFSKRDNSIFISFPYYKNSLGLLALAPMEKHLKKTDINLEHFGKITSHLVKYAHHPDGEAHFSQTGKILTKIRKKSVELKTAEGHLFSLHAQGLSSFESVTVSGMPSISGPKRSEICFMLNNKLPHAVKIVGYWHKKSTLDKRCKTPIGPKFECKTPSGEINPAFLLSPPEGYPLEENVLLLTCEEIPALDKTNKPLLLFVGGFDLPEIVNNLSVNSTFLACLYPAENYNELQQLLGSVDIVKQ